MRKTLLTLGLAALTTTAVYAESPHDHHMVMAFKGKETPYALELHQVNIKMHHDMNIEYSDNADIDFLKGMIPHHQGAVEMAQAVLKYGGSDHRVKRLAKEIIRAQNYEIAMMKRFLKQLEAKEAGYQDTKWLGDEDSLDRP